MTAIVQLPNITGPSKRRKPPWWLCPSSRELSLRSEIKMGYSTTGSRIAKNRHLPLLGTGEAIKISERELAVIKTVLAKARELEKVIQIRSESLIMDYEKLLKNTRGNGETNCILCGHDPLVSEKKLQLIPCDKCGKVACTVCYQRKRLQTGILIGLCKLCFDYQELWCKTGAWMTNKLPEKVTSDEEIQGFIQGERRGTIDAGECLFSEVEVQLDQGYLTPEEDHDSDQDPLKSSNVSSSYKNVKFTELEIKSNNSRRSSAPTIIEEMSDTASLRMSPVSVRRGSASDDRRQALSLDNRAKLSEIRDKVKTKVGSTLNTPGLLHDASFDSQDSDFEPMKIHESLDEKEADMSILISTPTKEEGGEPTLAIIEEDEDGRGSDTDSEKSLSLDGSDFEYGDVELPRRGTGFSRFGANRAPVVRKVRSTDEEQVTTDSEIESKKGTEADISRDSSIELVDASQREPDKPSKRPIRESWKIHELANSSLDDDGLVMDIPLTFDVTPPTLVITSPSSTNALVTDNDDELDLSLPALDSSTAGMSPQPSPQPSPIHSSIESGSLQEILVSPVPSTTSPPSMTSPPISTELPISPQPTMSLPQPPTVTPPKEPTVTLPKEPTVTPPKEPTVTPPKEPTVTPPKEPTVTPPQQPTSISPLPVIETIQQISVSPLESIQVPHEDQLSSVSSTSIIPPHQDADSVSPPSSNPSSTNSSPRKSSRRLRVLTSSGEESQDADGDAYRWRRRNATRNSVGVGSSRGKSTTPTTTNESNKTTTEENKATPTPDSNTTGLSKREKAKLAAKRVRESSGKRRVGGGGMMSRSRRLQQDDDEEFVSPDNSEQLI